MIKREINYDILRILAAALIVSIHSGDGHGVGIDQFYYCASRIAIPLFVMLSGAFLLNDKRTCEFGAFYRHSGLKLGIPFLAFSLFYILFDWFIYTFNREAFGDSPPPFWEPIANFFLKGTFYHLWFLYMLAGLYLVAPLLARLKQDVTEKEFLLASILLCMAGCIIALKQPYTFWMLQWVQYAGLFMIGASLRSHFKAAHSNTKGVLLIGLSLFGLIIWYACAGEETDEPVLKWMQGYLSPALDLLAIVLFIAFSLLSPSQKFHSGRAYQFIVFLSASSYFVYLLHPFYVAIESRILNILSHQFSPLYFRPLNAIIVFMACVATRALLLRLAALIRSADTLKE